MKNYDDMTVAELEEEIDKLEEEIDNLKAEVKKRQNHLESFEYEDGNFFFGGYRITSLKTDAEEVVVPDGVTAIGKAAFEGCSFTKIKLPESLRVIDSHAFKGCAGLEFLDIPWQVEDIGIGAFEGCTSLKNVVISGNAVRTVSASAFKNCRSLEYLIIPEGVERIGMRAFEGCTNLKNIVLPRSLKVIYPEAFEACPLLKTLSYCGTEAEWALIDMDCSSHIIREMKVKYDFELTWSTFWNL